MNLYVRTANLSDLSLHELILKLYKLDELVQSVSVLTGSQDLSDEGKKVVLVLWAEVLIYQESVSVALAARFPGLGMYAGKIDEQRYIVDVRKGSNTYCFRSPNRFPDALPFPVESVSSAIAAR